MSEQRDAASDRAICDAATPVAPDTWRCRYWEGLAPQSKQFVEMTMADWQFCCTARTALPYWIAEAERLRAENETLRAKVAEMDLQIRGLEVFLEGDEPEDDLVDCHDCDGDGDVCDECGETAANCECEEFTPAPCPTCDGNGVLRDD